MRLLHALASLIGVFLPLPAAEPLYLLQQPAINQTHIVFSYAGDLWQVPRAGGVAVRLTSGVGEESQPVFSPDGTRIAFTGEYDGSMDVFVMDAAGGIPRRLTAHPMADRAAGWTPDGQYVLTTSMREAATPEPRLYRVPAAGGHVEPLPFPSGAAGSMSPDGRQIAYLPLARADQVWKRYRGGRTSPIWIGNLADSSVTPIPRQNSNDFSPMWVGKSIYFLSDRLGSVTLFQYDTPTRKVTSVLDNPGRDIKTASAWRDAIVYEQFGSIHLLDLKTRQTRPVPIQIHADLTEVRPRLVKVARHIQGGTLSPSGTRAVFEARGDVFTLPVDKGAPRNLTATSGAAERFPAWSPDGKWIAYFSDASGEYTLHVAQQNGSGEVRQFVPGPPSFYYDPVWSPDSKKLVYRDKRLNLWYLDLDKGTPVAIDKGTYQVSGAYFEPAWSPDSRWIVYAKQLPTRYCALFAYSLANNKTNQLTDGMADARSPAWDRSGRYLYFAASTDAGPAMPGVDMSAAGRPVTRTLYLMLLRSKDPSPLAAETDEEGARQTPPSAPATEPVTIDFDGLADRTLPLPTPPRNYANLSPGRAGVLFLRELPGTLYRFDLARRRLDKLADAVDSYSLSANGDRVLYASARQWFAASSAALVKAGEGRLKTEDLETTVDPTAEWQQMHREVLRLERDFFYDPNHHGADLAALAERYQPYVRHASTRDDLNSIWREMLRELSAGHLYVTGGDGREKIRIKGGLLGADYTVENGHYRFQRIYTGEQWNPETRAPLRHPGIVKPGDYLFAVNGKPVAIDAEVHAAFTGTAGKPTTLRVGPDPSGAGARDVNVIPIEDDTPLRRFAWMEENRRKVDELSGGRIAYVYLPNTSASGYAAFNRYYYAQVDKQALILDERFNGGGQVADSVIDILRRPLFNYFTARDGQDYTTPASAIFGPKVMLINEYAGSGGDVLPWLFRRAQLGPLVGKRTWGGTVGLIATPALIDGGTVTAPHFAFYSPESRWELENQGIAPDVEVDIVPQAWRQGRDTQLERAVAVALEQLKRNPPPAKPTRPPYPNYHRNEPIPSSGGAQE
ncbi:MAG: PD40 domain-containing protein [Bryobacterales bacterium]|nr:PD40 domain-containing protein [Bryobacterales bacterium]